MNDIGTLTAQPQILSVAGRQYRVYPLTMNDFGKLQAWVDAQFPDPYASVSKAIAAGEYTYEQQKHLFKLAVDRATQARRLIGTAEADELLTSVEGYKQIILLSIRKGDPAFSAEDAEELFSKMTFVDVARLQTATNVDMVVGAPKPTSLDVTPLDGSAITPSELTAARRSTGGRSSTRR